MTLRYTTRGMPTKFRTFIPPEELDIEQCRDMLLDLASRALLLDWLTRDMKCTYVLETNEIHLGPGLMEFLKPIYTVAYDPVATSNSGLSTITTMIKNIWK